MVGLFTSGLLITLSPCAFFLIPLVFISLKQKQGIRSTIVFLLGFLAGGFVLMSFAHSIKVITTFNTIKLSIGLFLIALGIYNHYRAINIKHKHFNKLGPFALGLIIPILSSISGCGLPIFASISVIINKNLFLLNTLVFTAGMVVPYLIVILFKDIALKKLKKMQNVSSKYIHTFNTWLLILTGLYTVFSVSFLSINHINGILIIVTIIFFILCYLTCKKAKTHIWILFLTAFIAFFLWNVAMQACKYFAQINFFGPIESVKYLKNLISTSPHTCTGKFTFCPYCLTCDIIFIIITWITTYTYIKTTDKYGSKNR